MNFDKLKRYFHERTDTPESSLDMKKASLIRKHHPKYDNWDIKALKRDPIWAATNTSGELTKQ